jgi:hypothetical protein
MAYSQAPVVRLERQPHRDAVIRVREAYRRLLRSQPLPVPKLPCSPENAVRRANGQEVQV